MEAVVEQIELIESLVEDMSHQATISGEMGEHELACSFENESGVLLSRKDAELCIQALKEKLQQLK